MNFRISALSLVSTGMLLALSACGDHLGFDAAVDAASDSGPHDSGTDVFRADVSDATSDIADGASDTGLVDASLDVAPDVHDAAMDVSVDAASDATIDASSDVFDAQPDATADVGTMDVHADVAVDVTAADVHADVTDAGVDAPPAWRHTIAIDGTNDFAASTESFTTTSTGYTAYVTWDSSNLYIGYNGADISSGSMTRWLFAFIDTDPGTGIGASASPSYNSETVGFPTGFAPEFYLRWRASNDFQTIEQYTAGAWSTSTATPQTFQSGNFVEFRIPLSAISNPTRFGVTILMMNEAAGTEAAYGGIYSGNFTDGYHATVPVTAYLQVDLSSSLAPNNAANRH